MALPRPFPQNNCRDHALHRRTDDAVYPEDHALDRLDTLGRGVHGEITALPVILVVLLEDTLVPAADRGDATDHGLGADRVVVTDRHEDTVVDPVEEAVITTNVIAMDRPAVTAVDRAEADSAGTVTNGRRFVERDAFIAERWDIGPGTVPIWTEGGGASTAERMAIWPERAR